MINIFVNLLFTILVSLYSLNLVKSDGSTINMNSFQGKKILLVNISTGSPRVGQLAGLQQLQDQYSDSLVIIAFPSNSFGTESKTDAQISSYCQTNYQTSFIIAAKTAVVGTGTNSIYGWLSDSTQNGALYGTVIGDFQKFLVDKNGQLIGVFSPAVEPMDSTIQQALIGQ